MNLQDHPVYGAAPGPRPRFTSVWTDGADQTEAIEIEPGIFQSRGASDAYLVTTPAGNVLINAGLPHEGYRHRRLFRAADDGPVTHIVLTQGHYDHLGGVELFREPGTEVIAHRAIRELLAYQQRFEPYRLQRNLVFFTPNIERSLTAMAEEPIGEGPYPTLTVEPTVEVDDAYAFEVGGERFELYAVPGGETTDSLCVWLPGRRLVFTGNQFGPLFPHFPNFVTIRGDLVRMPLPYLESLERVRALEPEVLVTGHYEPIRGAARIQKALGDLARAVRHVHDAVVEGMNDGKDVHTLMAEIRLPADVDVGEGYGKVSWGVRAIWEHYQGWFHFDSTTSLYPVPARDVYPELASLAGGPDALARAAEARLAAGEPLAAIHLTEVALAGAPAHRPSLRAQLRGHEVLLERSGGENFWEWTWLRHRIHELRTALAAAPGEDDDA